MIGSALAHVETDAAAAEVSGRAARPAERLMIAVLEQARADLALPPGALARRDAERWLHADDEAWPLSFARICRHFAIDLGAARAALLAAR
jgi:hypothetical protein